ncbi:hypothetical protein SVIO_065390 [Streptomyces violaceusniger]|uniref:ABC-2 type transporter domain-containing protein n=2 Tax=Streptomyces violaceusniger TaxID=68280 RepID=A0A4D4L9Q1_STRVO|nr:hypothetical protein SVIO_065390 [Streptomyces violaceusniger]
MSSHIMSEVEAVADRVGIIRDGRLAALGTAAVAMMYASTYPSQKNNTASLPEAMRDALHIDATAAGYLQASVFGLILPLLAMIYGIATGSRAIAGEEESGQLDLLLAHPVTRTAVVLQRFGALVTGAGAAFGRRVVVRAPRRCRGRVRGAGRGPFRTPRPEQLTVRTARHGRRAPTQAQA